MQTSAQKIEIAERRALALELRRQKKTFIEIGELLGVHPSSARRIVWEAISNLGENAQENAAKMRDQEVADLGVLEETLMERAAEGNMDAMDRVLKIKERRAKLMGLDAPAKTESKSTTVVYGVNLDEANRDELIAMARQLEIPIPAELLENSKEPPKRVEVLGPVVTVEETQE